MSPQIPADPVCRFCGEIAMATVVYTEENAAFWCGTCGVLAEFENLPANEHQPARWKEEWTEPSRPGRKEPA